MDPPPAPPPPPPLLGRIRSKSCDVRGCTSNSLRNPDLLFIGVPSHSYPERRFVWLTLMQALRDKKRSFCCSRHFTVPDDFKDFQEFITAPPGYKRQLLVKKGVVPHLNMPLLNLSALPPLTDRWPMTLPVGMTESDRLKQAAAASAAAQQNYLQGTMETLANSGSPAHHGSQIRSFVPNKSSIKLCKAVQTDGRSVMLRGQRKVQASLQYCRLCFKRQDLEPIFTGDQTLIEPDLIDKIYGCTEVMITVEYDFPSSICTACYGSVQDFIKFRQLVQRNDRTLRTTVAPQKGPIHGRPGQPPVATSSVRTKTTDMNIPRKFVNVTPVRGSHTVPSPCSAATQVRNTVSNPPARIQTAPLQRTIQTDDPLLKVGHVEDVQTYEKRHQAIERYHPRAQRMQDSLFPVPYRRKPLEADPLANADSLPNGGQQSTTEQSSEIQGVRMGDRVVPVTLIRIQEEEEEPGTDAEREVGNRVESQPPKETPAHKENEDVTVKLEEDGTGEVDSVTAPSKQYLTPKPIDQLVESMNKSKDAPNVLEAVQLIPKSGADEVAKQNSTPKPARPFPRPFTTPAKRFEIPRILKVIRSTGKQEILKRPSLPMLRMVPKTVRAVKFPGTLTTLFSRPKISPKPLARSSKPGPQSKQIPTSKTVETQTVAEIQKNRSSVESPKVLVAPQVLKEVTIAEKPLSESPRLQTRFVKPNQPPQKENNVPTPTKQAITRKLPMDSSTVDKLDQKKQAEKNDPRTPKEPGTKKPPTETPKPPKPIQTKQKEKEILVSPKEPTPKASPQIPPEATLNASPRSSRTRKVPLKFQDAVGFPKPKIVAVKPDSDTEKLEPVKAPEIPKTRLPSGRKSGVPASEDEPVETKKNPAVKSIEPAKPKSGEQEIAETKKLSARSSGRKSDLAPTKPTVDANTKPSTPPKVEESRSRPAKRKSVPDEKADPVAKEVPVVKLPKLQVKRASLEPVAKSPKLQAKRASLEPVAKSPKLQAKRASLEPVAKPPKLQAKRSSLEPVAKPPKLQAKRSSLEPVAKSPKLQAKRASLEPPKDKGKQQRANGSRKTVPSEAPKKKEVETIPAVTSSQDWKCPFCPDKVYNQKKGLVKHLRRRHGMDYALVRQRLAIYGGNWR